MLIKYYTCVYAGTSMIHRRCEFRAFSSWRYRVCVLSVGVHVVVEYGACFYLSTSISRIQENPSTGQSFTIFRHRIRRKNISHW